jgi:hypothetical protein
MLQEHDKPARIHAPQPEGTESYFPAEMDHLNLMEEA